MVKFHVSEMEDARSILFSFVHETSDSIASFFDEIAKEVRIVVLTVDWLTDSVGWRSHI